MNQVPTAPSRDDAPSSTSETITKAAGNAHDAVDKAAQSAQEAVSSVRPFIARTADSAHHTVDKVTDVVGPAADWFARQGEALAATSRTAEADARAYVVSHPWQAVGLAAGLGYLLGLLARR